MTERHERARGGIKGIDRKGGNHRNSKKNISREPTKSKRGKEGNCVARIKKFAGKRAWSPRQKIYAQISKKWKLVRAERETCHMGTGQLLDKLNRRGGGEKKKQEGDWVLSKRKI